jgi:hypothetical protein
MFLANSGLQYFRDQPIKWSGNLGYAFYFVAGIILFSWLFGDFDKKKADH